jgi:hypothetical protein
MHDRLTGFAHDIAKQCLRLARAVIARHDAWVVLCTNAEIQCPPVCASCLEPATITRSETSPSDGTTIKAPYCASCLQAVAKQQVFHFGAVLSSVLLGIAAGLFLPLAPFITKPVAVTAALLITAVPWLFETLWQGLQSQRGLPLGRAAYPTKKGVTCSNAEWARRLGSHLGARVEHSRPHWVTTMGGSIAGLVIAATATPLLYDVFHCEVRVVNLTENDLDVWVDRRWVATVRATSQESPLAGNLLRIASGTRLLEARQRDGVEVMQSDVSIRAGQSYLYAPAHPAGTCFWIERTTAGRSRSQDLAREPLSNERDFWELPVAIDLWFSSPVGLEAGTFTGGVVTALRQGPCGLLGEPRGARTTTF